MLKIIVADDHPVVRQGLIQILTSSFSSALILGVPDGEQLLKLVTTEEWDLVISDISMPGISGLEVLSEIRKCSPDIPVLLLSIYSEEIYAIRVMQAGASGFMNKDFSPEDLISVVTRLLSGRKYVSQKMADSLIDAMDATGNRSAEHILSGREFEVLRHIGSGLAISQIATRLSLGVTSISTYRSRILVKLNLHTTSDLIHYSIENGLA